MSVLNASAHPLWLKAFILMEIGAKSGWSFQQKHLREVVKTVKNCKNNKQANKPKTPQRQTA